MGEKGSDDWSFEVEEKKESETQEEINLKRPSPSKPSLKKISSTSKNKEIELSLKSKVITKSRSADAREMQAEFEAQHEDLDIPMGPNISLRAQAFLIDTFTCLLGVVGLYFYDKMLFKMPRSVASFIPHDLRNYGDQYLLAAVFFFAFYLIVVVLFTAVSGRSIGKKFTRLIVKSTDESSVSFVQVLWRELIVKPISVISIVGILFYFIEGKRRMLHDYLSGTSLFYN